MKLSSLPLVSRACFAASSSELANYGSTFSSVKHPHTNKSGTFAAEPFVFLASPKLASTRSIFLVLQLCIPLCSSYSSLHVLWRPASLMHLSSYQKVRVRQTVLCGKLTLFQFQFSVDSTIPSNSQMYDSQSSAVALKCSALTFAVFVLVSSFWMYSKAQDCAYN